MKVFIALSVARQVMGEIVFVKIEKVTSNRDSADSFYRDQSTKTRMIVENVECDVERSILEAELE